MPKVTAPNSRLYRLLDVDPESTSESIRLSFERMSLREQFHQAYYVVGNPDRKRLYDMGGERIVDYLLSKSWGPVVSKLGATWSLRLYSFCLLSGSILLTLWFVLLAIKIDHVRAVEWSSVFVPLLMILFGYVAVHFLSVFCAVTTPISLVDSDGFVLDRIPPWANLLSACCYAVFAMITAVYLQDPVGTEVASAGWSRIISLLIVGDVLGILSSCMWRHPEKVRKSLDLKPRDAEPRTLVYGFSVLVCMHSALAVARWVMIGLKLAGSYQGSWYRVFAPIPCRLALSVVEVLLNGLYLRRMRVRSGDEVVFTVLGSLFLGSLITVSVYMLAATLEGARLVSMGNILTPIYVMCGYLILSSVFTTVYVLRTNTLLEIKDRAHMVLNPVAHDPFAAGNRCGVAVVPESARHVPMVGGVPVLMPDAGRRGVVHRDLGDYIQEEIVEEEEMEEVEIDDEAEHYIDQPQFEHSPFEGTASVDSRYAERYGAADGGGGGHAVAVGGAVRYRSGVSSRDGGSSVGFFPPYGSTPPRWLRYETPRAVDDSYQPLPAPPMSSLN